VRHLHPVAPAEQFAASGLHRHTPSGLVEHWSVHRQPGGALLTRVDCDGRASDGRSLLIEAWRAPEGVVERFSLRAYGGAADSFQVLRADFVLYGDRVEVGQSVNGGPRQDSTLPLLTAAAACPDATVFRGLALRWAARLGVPVSLVTTAAFTSAPPLGGVVLDALGAPEWCADDLITVDGRPIPAQRWRWPGVPGFEGDLWLDAHGTVLRHNRPDGTAITLARYARRMEPTAHD
jgi:hypothetical protein